MRYLVLSDLHSNLEAYESAMAEARALGFDRVLVLGDLVGYGPDPNGIIDALRSLEGAAIIRGNHDRVAARLSGADDFNAAARTSAEWTHRSLRPDNLEFLAALPQGPVPFGSDRLLAHGTPLDEDTYLLDAGEARRCFQAMPFDLCLFGHTHFPSVFTYAEEQAHGRLLRGDRVEFALEIGTRHMLNPGSLGQPRDRNPKCSFGMYDEQAGTFTVHRVEYPIERVRKKILDAGLPPALGDRLRLGL
jgi:predicted phosphodiesterase